MMNRRIFTALLAGASVAPNAAWSQTENRKVFFYASVGSALVLHQVDAEGASLVRREAVMLPADVQYAWPHPTAPLLYVVSSNGGAASLGVKGDKHYLSVLRIDPRSGVQQLHGPSSSLRSRPDQHDGRSYRQLRADRLQQSVRRFGAPH